MGAGPQANEALGKLPEALKDLRLLLSLDKKNAAAVESARRIAAGIHADMHDPCKAAAELRRVLATCTGTGASATADSSVVSSSLPSSIPPTASVHEKLVWLEGSLAGSAAVAVEFLRAGVVPDVLTLAETDARALNLFRGVVRHEVCVASLLLGRVPPREKDGVVDATLPWDPLFPASSSSGSSSGSSGSSSSSGSGSGSRTGSSAGASTTSAAAAAAAAGPAALLAVGIVPQLRDIVLRGVAASSTVAMATVACAGVDLLGDLYSRTPSVAPYHAVLLAAVLDVLQRVLAERIVVDVSYHSGGSGAGAGSSTVDGMGVRIHALQVLAQLCANAAAAKEASDRKVIHAAVRLCNIENADVRQVSAALLWCGVVWCGVVWCGVVWCHMAHSKKCCVIVGCCVPQTAASCLTQCLKTLLKGGVNDAAPKASQRAALEAQREYVKGLILDLCVAAVHKPEDAERVALRMEDVERATVVIRSLFLIDRELGLWLLEQVAHNPPAPVDATVC